MQVVVYSVILQVLVSILIMLPVGNSIGAKSFVGIYKQMLESWPKPNVGVGSIWRKTKPAALLDNN